MAKPFARLVLPRATGSTARFRMAPRRDDLRHRGHERCTADRFSRPLEDDDDEDLEEDEVDRAAGVTPGQWAAWANAALKEPGNYEELYGSMSRPAWKRYWFDRGGRPNEPDRQATAPAAMSEAIRSGAQPKEEVYRVIREAYMEEHGTGDGHGDR
eukprot:gnl/TRDRNA2_/TRDRNA2_124545_c0_seq1.p1 gnl/TRDRNA2_/TRDRNA2_124545_c0~~gnl/TRDRNA2_/TRDRNA2_124545_c0_seq1.p1  ORF type:complete len:156 (+),score=30.31 gnl/TRDRNA2_/TRDRNA2_124545_c0_seq1:81-548(+)